MKPFLSSCKIVIIFVLKFLNFINPRRNFSEIVVYLSFCMAVWRMYVPMYQLFICIFVSIFYRCLTHIWVIYCGDLTYICRECVRKKIILVGAVNMLFMKILLLCFNLVHSLMNCHLWFVCLRLRCLSISLLGQTFRPTLRSQRQRRTAGGRTQSCALSR